MSTQMLLYKNVTALSRQKHRNLKLKPAENASFAAEAHWIPVAGGEFMQAACHYPIIFISESSDAPVIPILALGFQSGRNNYVSKDGHWLQNYYIPAFIRRYPFVPATVPDGVEDAVSCNDDTIMCIDNTWEGFSETEGDSLFTEDGGNDPFLDEIIQFMNDYQEEMRHTQDFVATLQRLDLLKRTDIDVQSPEGAMLNLSDILIIDEEKLAQLSGEQLAELNDLDYLSWVFAHLVSLGNFPKLLDMAMIADEEVSETPSAGEHADTIDKNMSAQEGNTL